VPAIPPGYSALSPSITANALGGGIGKLWERFPGALWGGAGDSKARQRTFMSDGEAWRAKISQ